MTRTLLPLLLLALGCGTARSPSDGSEQDLQGGSIDRSDPAVGRLWMRGGNCTGTLISPDVVLTAGHCVGAKIKGFYTGTGTESPNASDEPPRDMVAHAVDDMRAHPTYVPEPVRVETSPGVPVAHQNCPNSTLDIGLVHLTQPVTDIAPVRYAKTNDLQVGTVCRTVGFGLHNEADGGFTTHAKRTGSEKITSIGATAIELGFDTALTDHGDSGGPLLYREVVVGTTSCHFDGDWPQHQISYSARVDVAATWIDCMVVRWDGERCATL